MRGGIVQFESKGDELERSDNKGKIILKYKRGM